MPRREPEIPHDLERQLAAIERSANIIPPHILVEDVFDLPPIPRRAPTNSPLRHALVADLRRSIREAGRVRRVGVFLAVMGMLAVISGTMLTKLDYLLSGGVTLLVGGSLLGFAAVSLYKAAGRVHRAETALGQLDSRAEAD